MKRKNILEKLICIFITIVLIIYFLTFVTFNKICFIFHLSFLKKPYVSFILPIFNKGHYLNRSIGGILKEKYSDYEIICVNDGSIDNSEKIINKFIIKDSRVKYIKFEKNKGIVKSRFEGVKKSKGLFIFSFDPDDEIYPNSLSDYITYQKKMNSDILNGKILEIFCTKNKTREWGVYDKILTKNEMINLLWESKFDYTVYKLIRKEIFSKAIRTIEEKFPLKFIHAEDLIIVGTIITYANNFTYYNKIIYIYYSCLSDNSRVVKYKGYFTSKEAVKLITSFLSILHNKSIQISPILR